MHLNHICNWDNIFDRTYKASTLKIRTMLSELASHCIAFRVERQIRSEQVVATPWRALTLYGLPQYTRIDNGAEFIAKKI